MLKALFIAIVAIHYILIILVGLSIPMLILSTEWFIWLPLTVLIIQIPTNLSRCPLTELENVVRRKMGKPTIRSFIKEYIWPASIS